MTEVQTYEIFYDKEADFLEVFFGEPNKSYAEEVEQGVFIRKDDKTNEIKSIGIISFKKRIEVFKRILEKNNLSIPLNISM